MTVHSSIVGLRSSVVDWRLLFDPDGLDIGELARSPGREFATIPASLDATEGHIPVRGGHAINEDGARFDFTGETLGLFDIAGPERPTETVLRIVGDLNCCLLVRHADDGSDRSERF